jgi:hypothetical protein
LKTPPPNDDFVTPAGLQLSNEKDRRVLVFAGLVLISLALGLKSELVAPEAVWWLAAGLVVVSSPLVLAYVRRGDGTGGPAVEHFVPALMGAVAIAGLSLVIRDGWAWALAAVAFGGGLATAARLDYLQLRLVAKRGHHFLQEGLLALALAGGLLAILAAPFSLLLKLAAIFTLSALAAYRSFRVSGDPMTPNRGLLFALLVGQVATFFAWAIFSYAAAAPEGVFAAMLLLAWYINRGVVRHAAEETLNRNVVVEYALFTALLAFLFLISLRWRG